MVSALWLVRNYSRTLTFGCFVIKSDVITQISGFCIIVA